MKILLLIMLLGTISLLAALNVHKPAAPEAAPAVGG